MNRSKSMSSLELFDLGDPSAYFNGREASSLESDSKSVNGSASHDWLEQLAGSSKEVDIDFITDPSPDSFARSGAQNPCIEGPKACGVNVRPEHEHDAIGAEFTVPSGSSSLPSQTGENVIHIVAQQSNTGQDSIKAASTSRLASCEESVIVQRDSSIQQACSIDYSPNIEIDEELIYEGAIPEEPTGFYGDIVSELVSELVEATVASNVSDSRGHQRKSSLGESCLGLESEVLERAAIKSKKFHERNSGNMEGTILQNSMDFACPEEVPVIEEGPAFLGQDFGQDENVLQESDIDECDDIPEEPSPLSSEFEGPSLSASASHDFEIPADSSTEFSVSQMQAPSFSFDVESEPVDSPLSSVEVCRSFPDNAIRSLSTENNLDILDKTFTGTTPSLLLYDQSQLFQSTKPNEQIASETLQSEVASMSPLIPEQSFIFNLASDLGSFEDSLADENWQPSAKLALNAADTKKPTGTIPKAFEEEDVDLFKFNKGASVPPPVPCHRRFRSDNTEGSTSSFKIKLKDSRNGQQDDSELSAVAMHHVETRNTTVGSRCKSQLLLRDSSTSDDTTGDHSDLDSHKNLSTSTPSVHDGSFSSLSPEQAEREVVAEVLHIGETRDAQNEDAARKGAKNWSQLMPSTFGAHQVISPMQRATRLIPTSGVMIETTARSHKSKVEKKPRKTSGFLDFFPSVRKRPQTAQKVIIRGSGVSHPIDRRITMANEQTSHAEYLPNDLAAALQHDRPSTIGVTEGRVWAAKLKEEADFVPQINKPKWADLGLWRDEPTSWSSKNSNIKLPKQERKKQDVIYELYLTEKHYCQVLVVLQQVYQEGLRVRQILPDDKRNELIPTVLDALMDFHLNLLRKLKTRLDENVVVSGISDIICSEFEFGDKNRAAVYAYTEICSKKDFCGRLYDIYRMKNFELRKFFDEFEKSAAYKDRTFKMCLLIIAQRLTKYPILLDQIVKLESLSGKEDGLRALQAVKKFAEHVDTELNKIEMNRRWDRLRSQISRSSVGRHNQNVSFTYADLVLSDGPEQRKVIRIGDATCYSNPSTLKSEDGVEVKLALFDDILVILSKAQGKSAFVFHDRGPSGCSVIKVKTMIVRDVARKSLMLFIIARNHPASDLIPVEFPSKSEFAEWKKILEEAIEAAPSFVRRATNSEGKVFSDHAEDPEETKFIAELEKWETRLHELFERRKRSEDDLSLFIEKRLRWFEELQAHLKNMPVKARSDGQKPVISEKIKASVRKKFDELRMIRYSSLSKVMEGAQKACEEEILAYFDDQHDANVWAVDTGPSSDHSESADESRPKLPRRHRTFNGTPDIQKETAIRRHTTEPRLAEKRSGEQESQSAVESSELRTLAQNLCPPARRSLAHIVEECVKVRVENNRLRDDVAMMSLQMVAMRTRPSTAASVTALEALRNKQNKLQEDQVAFQSYRDSMEEELRRKEEEISEKERQLKASEEQLEEKWKTFIEAANPDGVSKHRPLGPTRPVLPTTSFRSSGAHHSNAVSPRQLQPSPLNKSASSSSMPLHLAEKTSKVARNKK